MYQRQYLIDLHYRKAPQTFIKCIQEAMKYLDGNIFSIHVNHPSQISRIQDVSPNWKTIENYIEKTQDTANAVFLAAFCCFFDNSLGFILLDNLGCKTIRDMAEVLDYNQLNIITTLMLNHQ